MNLRKAIYHVNLRQAPNPRARRSIRFGTRYSRLISVLASLALVTVVTVAIGPPQASTDEISVAFSDESGTTLSTIVLPDGDSQVQFHVSVTGLDAGIHDAIQLLMRHDPAVTSLVSASCTGLFEGGISPASVVEIAPGDLAFVCAIPGGVDSPDGLAATFTLQRIAPGSDAFEMLTDGPFGTRIYASGLPTEVAPANSLTVSTPVATPTPVSTATVAATATAAPTSTPVSGGNGGGGFVPPPQPTATPAPQVPGPPDNVQLTSLDGAIDVAWSPPTSDGGSPITGYTVRSGDGAINQVVSQPVTATRITGLQNGSSYSFRVSAANYVGSGPYSEPSVAVIPAGPPSAPESLTATIEVSSGTAVLDWQPPSDSKGASIESYLIESVEPDTFTPVTIGSDIHSYKLTGLPPGQHGFAVSAANRAGIGPAATATVEIQAPATSTPLPPTETPTPLPTTVSLQSAPEPAPVPAAASASPIVPSPTPVVLPTQTVSTPPSPTPIETPTPLPTATALPLLAPTAAPPDAPLPEIPDGDTSTATTAVVIIAIAAVAGVAVIGAGGYLITRNGGSPLPVVLVPFTLVALVLASAPGDEMARTARAVGGVGDEGDIAQRSDLLRAEFGVDGTDVVVAIISDSFDCMEQANSDIAAGFLPADMSILRDAPLCASATDRGRAIAQIVHLVAPGATLLFHDALMSKSDLASAINDMVVAGADIIVDDMWFSNELAFQDDAVAQAIQQATADGVIYLTAAGDTGVSTYEAGFVDGGSAGALCSGKTATYCIAHDFDSGPGTDQFLDVTFNGTQTILSVQWDQPGSSAGGAANAADLDLFVMDTGGSIIQSATVNNITSGEPVEVMPLSGVTDARISVVYRNGDLPGQIKLMANTPFTVNDHPAGSATITGHRNSASAITVGSVHYSDAVFGGTPVVEPSSSRGNVAVLFNTDGNVLDAPDVRQKPDISAPAGVTTTPGLLNGTSAAVAHTAGLAALLLEMGADLHDAGKLGNEQVRFLLTSTAENIGAPGYDPESGYGLVDTLAAGNLLSNEPPQAGSDSYSVGMNGLLEVSAPGVLENDFDANGHDAWPVTTADTSHGTLSLETDGSFVYTPAPGFVGADSFTYVVTDGYFTSEAATVEISVEGIESINVPVTLQGVNTGGNFGGDQPQLTLTSAENMRVVSFAPDIDTPLLVNGLAPGTYTLTVTAPGYLLAELPGVVLGTVPGEPVPVSAVQLFAGDSDGNGSIDTDDATAIATAFGTQKSPGYRHDAVENVVDLNGDGIVNAADLSLTVSNLGLSSPTGW